MLVFQILGPYSGTGERYDHFSPSDRSCSMLLEGTVAVFLFLNTLAVIDAFRSVWA